MDSTHKYSTRLYQTKWRKLKSSPWFHMAVALLLIAVVHGFLVKPYGVPSGSMEQTLQVGDRIYVNRIKNTLQDPQRGRIVVFNASDVWKQADGQSGLRWLAGSVGDVLGFGPSNHKALVKRIIGLPGDNVSCCSADGSIEVNGTALEERYVYNDYPFIPGRLDCQTVTVSRRCYTTIHVPENHYLVMGDHRSNSSDSVIACRPPLLSEEQSLGCARFVKREDIVGEVFFRVWPFSRAGSI